MNRLLAIAAVLVLVAACSSFTAPPPAPIDAPDGPRDEMAEAIEFRRQFGLRADQAWVQHVAANPRAGHEFGVPLMPEEEAELMARQRNADAVVAAVETHAAGSRAEFGGVYIDQQQGGTVVALFTANLDAHERAIRAMLHPEARFAVRQVRWSEAQLRRLQDRLVQEQEWFEANQAMLTSASTDIIENVTEVTVSSANPQIEELTIAHFGAAGMLRVHSDGTGVLFLPQGTIVGRVVDRAGRPVEGASIEYSPLFDAGPLAGVGHVSGANGMFRIDDVIPGHWRVDVWSDGEAIASSEVDVPPGGVGNAVITVDQPLPNP